MSIDSRGGYIDSNPMIQPNANHKQNGRLPSVAAASLPIVLTLAVLSYHIFVNQGAPHIPLVIGIFITSLVGLAHGITWSEIQEGITSNVAISVPVLGIMFTVGMTISTWILCGTVPLLIKLGILIIAPAVFLPVTCIVCAVVSVATGTSWGTVGTIGLALLGVGEGMGVPMYLTAGAVVSGAWFGDKMSPLSDTTNFAAAIVGADLYSHIRNMLPSTIPAMLIALVLYGIIGAEYAGNQIQADDLEEFARQIDASFVSSIFVLIPPIVILITVWRKIPPLPGIFLGVVAAALVGLFVQDASIGDVIGTMMTGYVSDTGNRQLDTLLSKGGVHDVGCLSYHDCYGFWRCPGAHKIPRSNRQRDSREAFQQSIVDHDIASRGIRFQPLEQCVYRLHRDWSNVCPGISWHATVYRQSLTFIGRRRNDDGAADSVEFGGRIRKRHTWSPDPGLRTLRFRKLDRAAVRPDLGMDGLLCAGGIGRGTPQLGNAE
jgi:hypothetical protein